MSDENDNKPTLTRKPLTLSRSLESGEVKQTFSHGRTNKVVVEVKRKKLVGKPGYVPEPEVAAPPPPPPPAAAPAGQVGPSVSMKPIAPGWLLVACVDVMCLCVGGVCGWCGQSEKGTEQAQNVPLGQRPAWRGALVPA
jgi:hypothetical protein